MGETVWHILKIRPLQFLLPETNCHLKKRLKKVLVSCVTVFYTYNESSFDLFFCCWTHSSALELSMEEGGHDISVALPDQHFSLQTTST